MKKKFVRTETLLLKQIEDDEKNPFYHQNYVRILAAQKRYEDVIRAANRAFEVCGDRMNPNNRQMISFDLAVALTNTGRHKEAENLCKGILDENPENLDMLFALASNKLKTGRYEEAVEGYKRFLDVLKKKKQQPRYEGLIIETYSYDHRAWASLSEAYTLLSKFDDALSAAEKALELKPDNGEYHVTFAKALVNCGRTDEALVHLKEQDKKKDPGADFYIKWAAATKTLPLGDAEEIYKQGISRYPESVELNANYAFFLESNDTLKAVEKWNYVLSLNEDYIEAYVHLTHMYAEERELDKLKATAVKFLNRCTRPLFLKNVGAACIKAQDYQTAIEVLSRYLQFYPDDGETLADVATCYVKIGQYEAAIIGYKAALQLDPSNSSVILNLERLEKILAGSAVGE